MSSRLKYYSPTNAKKFVSKGEPELIFEVRRYRFLGKAGAATFISPGGNDKSRTQASQGITNKSRWGELKLRCLSNI